MLQVYLQHITTGTWIIQATNAVHSPIPDSLKKLTPESLITQYIAKRVYASMVVKSDLMFDLLLLLTESECLF